MFVIDAHSFRWNSLALLFAYFHKYKIILKPEKNKFWNTGIPERHAWCHFVIKRNKKMTPYKQTLLHHPLSGFLAFLAVPNSHSPLKAVCYYFKNWTAGVKRASQETKSYFVSCPFNPMLSRLKKIFTSSERMNEKQVNPVRSLIWLDWLTDFHVYRTKSSRQATFKFFDLSFRSM